MKYIYITFLLFFIGCSSSLPDESLPLADHLKIGMDFLDQGKFVKAQDEFKFILSRGTGTDYGDDAQFFLAEAYFLNEQYMLSICLLYTSPSPRDLSTSRMPSSA